MVEIEAKKAITFEKLNCLIGMSLIPDQKCDRASVIKADWTLISGGKVIQTDTSDAGNGGGWTEDIIARELSTFWLRKGKAYVLYSRSKTRMIGLA
jgi:hypothetical protein